MLLRVGSGHVAQPLLHGSGDPDASIGTELLDERRRFRIRLELERLLRSFREPIGRPPPKVPRVEVCAAVHEDLNHFVQASKRGAMNCLEIGFVHGVDVGPGIEQERDRLFGHAGAVAALEARVERRAAESGRHHQRRGPVVGREAIVGAARQQRAKDVAADVGAADSARVLVAALSSAAIGRVRRDPERRGAAQVPSAAGEGFERALLRIADVAHHHRGCRRAGVDVAALRQKGLDQREPCGGGERPAYRHPVPEAVARAVALGPLAHPQLDRAGRRV